MSSIGSCFITCIFGASPLNGWLDWCKFINCYSFIWALLYFWRLSGDPKKNSSDSSFILSGAYCSKSTDDFMFPLCTVDGIMIWRFVTPVTIWPANEIELVPRLCLPWLDLFSEPLLMLPPLAPLYDVKLSKFESICVKFLWCLWEELVPDN